MGPEKSGAGLGPWWRRPTDYSPQGWLNTGLLRALLPTSSPPPSSFCLLLPRVQAAEADLHAPSPSSPRVAAMLGKPDFPDTGWDRIKDLFINDETRRCPEELANIIKSGMAAALGGLIYGGLPAGRHAREHFIQLSQSQIYSSRAEAVRSAHNAAIRGFIRYGWRWSWRVATFVTLFNTVSTGLSVYRDENSLSHYAAAGAVTGGLFRLNLGLRGLVAGTILGALMGIPTGALIIGMQSLGGETVRQRRRRERRELYELRLAEWTARLGMTDDVIYDLSAKAKPGEADHDLQRIQELLSLPPNRGVAEDSDSQRQHS